MTEDVTEEVLPEDIATEEAEEGGMLLGLGDADWQPSEVVGFGPGSRVIPLFGEFGDEMLLPLMSQLIELDRAEPETPITILLHSIGGDAVACFALADLVKALTSPIKIVVIGQAASAGLLFLQAADERVALPSARFFYHAPIAEGQAMTPYGAASFAANYKRMSDQAKKLMRAKTEISDADWLQFFDDTVGHEFGVDEALAWKVIDRLATAEDFHG
jgi:ATP-dependent protease ClpP protease subunit